VEVDPEHRKGIRILVVDDERTLRESCSSILETAGFPVTAAGKGDEALRMVRRHRPEIVLVDLYMSEVSGLEILREAMAVNPSALVIIMTGKACVESSIEALRAGAWSYIPKPFSATHLNILVGRAAHAVVIARESRRQQEEVEEETGHSERIKLLGTSRAFERVIEAARQVAATDASVFITGESGTGKELAAREIHDRSPFRGGPFVAVNCAGLPPHLIASELFGHEKGAFTSAHQRKVGQVEVARGGTLFLDEIGDLPLDVQGHLLRFLQDKTIQRVGSTRPIPVNLRIISATHIDCTRAIRDGRFREDLYYRLNVLRVHMPPLRERAEDIPVLAEFYLQQFTREHRRLIQGFQPAAEAAMRAYGWPGNVRELVSAIRRAAVMADGRWITAADLGLPPAATGPLAPLEAARREVEATLIRRALDLHGYNVQSAARALDVSRVTLYRLMEKHAIRAFDGNGGAWNHAFGGSEPRRGRRTARSRRRAGAQGRRPHGTA
jgi:DNA-binding NtrC family response regulator